MTRKQFILLSFHPTPLSEALVDDVDGVVGSAKDVYTRRKAFVDSRGQTVSTQTVLMQSRYVAEQLKAGESEKDLVWVTTIVGQHSATCPFLAKGAGENRVLIAS